MHVDIKSIVIYLILLLFVQEAQADDFDAIYKRMYDCYLKNNPSTEDVDRMIRGLKPDGSFVDIDYNSLKGVPRKHLYNLISLAVAYKHPQNVFYKNDKIKEAYLNSVLFWVNKDHRAANWWFRYIPYPKELSQSVVLMYEEIKMDKKLFSKIIEYIEWGYKNVKPSYMTGANGADIIMGAFTAAVLTKNKEQMDEYKHKITELLVVNHRDGVQADCLFSQHSGYGRQLYFANYGKEFVNSVLYYMEFCNKTKYQTPGVEHIKNLFENGVQWIFYNKHYDPNNAGRFISSELYSEEIRNMSERVKMIIPLDSVTNFQKVIEHVGGDNTLIGNKMFWCFDYMINRRENYMVSSRMTSTRTVGNEAGNGEGNFNYYSSNGVNYIFVKGDEYDGDFFREFNVRQYPGITAEQCTDSLPIPLWGEGGNNGDPFAGGVSDGMYGACAMKLNRRGLEANKAWFYFDNEFVALGCGIENKEGKADVYTTLNQCNLHGDVICGADNRIVKLEENVTLIPKWIFHNRIAYFNLYDSAFSIDITKNILSLNINHGTNPDNSKYAYIVCPGMNSVEELVDYDRNMSVSILSNTTEIQAVCHDKLDIIQMIFYKRGSILLKEGDSIFVDSSCAVMWNRKENIISISNPYCESECLKRIKVKFKKGCKCYDLDIDLPQGNMAGKSVSLRL